MKTSKLPIKAHMVCFVRPSALLDRAGHGKIVTTVFPAPCAAPQFKGEPGWMCAFEIPVMVVTYNPLTGTKTRGPHASYKSWFPQSVLIPLASITEDEETIIALDNPSLGDWS